MAAWVREEEKGSENRPRKREAKEADEVELVPRVTDPRTPEAASAVPIGKPENVIPSEREYGVDVTPWDANAR